MDRHASPDDRGGDRPTRPPPGATPRRGAPASARRPRPALAWVVRLALGLTLVAACLGVWRDRVDWEAIRSLMPDEPFAVTLRRRGYEDAAGSWHAALSVRGRFSTRAVVDLGRQLDEAGLRPGDLVVWSSGGGDLSQGMLVGRELRRRGLYTAVGTLDDGGAYAASGCASSCVLAYAGGAQRFAVAGSWLGVHQFAQVGRGGGDPLGRAQSVVADILSYLDDMGVSSKLLEIASKVPPTGVHWLSDEEVGATGVATVSVPSL